MIPQQLIIEGLYSYQDRQIIDFNKLTEAGLFGIFGAVGSGKSSILEAISFALYGQTERLNQGDKRNYNMMNLKSDKSFISFDFLNHKNELYRATRTYKRNSKNFEDVKPSSVILYKKTNNTWEPLDHTDAEKIIGLNYKNFKRTIIIPQGQFREFLDLGNTERTAMMKEIFPLEQYDLKNKTSALQKKTETELENLRGQLAGFDLVTEEMLTALQEQLKNNQISAAALQKTVDSTQEQFSQLRNLKSDFENLQKEKVRLNTLITQKSNIDKQKIKLDIYEKTQLTFSQLLLDKKRLETELIAKNTEQETQKQSLEHLEVEIETVKNGVITLQKDYDQLSDKKTEEKDLQFIIQISEYQEEIKMLVKRTEAGKKQVLEKKDLQQKIANDIKNLEDRSKTITAAKLDAASLLSIANWYAQQEYFTKNLSQITTNQKSIENQIAEKSYEIANFEIEEKTYKKEIAEKTRQLQQDRLKLNEEKNQLQIKEKISHYAHELQHGVPCPLCGSKEHPAIAAVENTSLDLQDLDNKIAENEKATESLRELEQKITKLIDNKAWFEKQLDDDYKKLTELQTTIDQHLTKFIWKEFDANNFQQFDKKRNESLAAEENLKQLETELNDKRREKDATQNQVDKFQETLSQFTIEQEKKSAQIQQNKDNLTQLNYEDFLVETRESLQNKQSVLKANNARIETTYKQYQERLAELNPKLSSQKTALELLQKRLAEIMIEQTDSNKNITEKLATQKLNSVAEVNEILSWQLDVTTLRTEIENFVIAFGISQNEVDRLEKKLSITPFDNLIYENTEQKLAEQKVDLGNANDQLANTRSDLARHELHFKKKTDLLQQLETLTKRSDNLAVMNALFRSGKGFVEYVSSIYLRELCDHANVRFHQMTRNQLSLQINDNYDFEVIDYLNEGRTRSVKTLSGGQGFQVSLCLALALAESVQSNASAEKNFFFIDEGFGTQDQESVNIVFETLTNLQKENRIVGIISHVEELKERIPISLTIVKDEEFGSKILD